MFRRINQQEDRIPARLFERHSEGCALTAARETMRTSAERIEAEIPPRKRQVVGKDVHLTETVHLTAPDDISKRLLHEPAAFCEPYPGILLDLIVANHFLNLSRRDAGVALRPSRDSGNTIGGSLSPPRRLYRCHRTDGRTRGLGRRLHLPYRFR